MINPKFNPPPTFVNSPPLPPHDSPRCQIRRPTRVIRSRPLQHSSLIIPHSSFPFPDVLVKHTYDAELCPRQIENSWTRLDKQPSTLALTARERRAVVPIPSHFCPR